MTQGVRGSWPPDPRPVFLCLHRLHLDKENIQPHSEHAAKQPLQDGELGALPLTSSIVRLLLTFMALTRGTWLIHRPLEPLLLGGPRGMRDAL